MAKLPEYSKLEEKERYFKNGKAVVIHNVDDMLKEFDNEKFIFRGCSEAKYKLYNSCQRHYITNELYRHTSKEDSYEHYSNLIVNLIDECKSWNKGNIQKMFQSNNIKDNNSIAYLSYMQHYLVPTPLLDFTRNPYIALFFAIDDISWKPSDIEIDNYFSIYTTYYTAQPFVSWNNVFERSISKLSDGEIPYDEVNKNDMNFIFPKDYDAYKVLNSCNIINQEGLFFYNNHPCNSLEENYLIAKDRIDTQGKTLAELRVHEKFANCSNIHKSLVPYLKQVLISKGITKEFIFPDANKMKNTILDKATIKALARCR